MAAPPDASGKTLTRYTYTRYLMGVDARLVMYAPDLATAERAGSAAFARVAALDTIMSDYRRDSELMRLCEHAGGPPVRVSPDLFRVLKRSQDIARLSGGAFDITAGPIIRLWRKARKEGVLPAPEEIEAARKLVGWQKLKLDETAHMAELTVPGMQLDLGGIGKGYGADGAQRMLKDHGITHALIQLGGDIVVTSAPPGTEGWAIKVLNAGDATTEGGVRYLANCAISTSGDTEQFAIIGGKRYSHVVDPRTGQALTNRVQVSVIAADGFTSDSLDTTLGIMGNADHSQLLREYPGTTIFVRVLPTQ